MDRHDYGEFGSFGQLALVTVRGGSKRRLLPGLACKIEALSAAGLRYITALTDPQIRTLLRQGTLQMGLFHEQVCEVEAGGIRYVLRKNEDEAARERHRLEDKLAKLAYKVE